MDHTRMIEIFGKALHLQSLCGNRRITFGPSDRLCNLDSGDRLRIGLFERRVGARHLL